MSQSTRHPTSGQSGGQVKSSRSNGKASIASEWHRRAADLAAWTDAQLINRRDAFGHYIAAEKRTDPDRTAVTDKAELTTEVLEKHYRGKSTGDLIGLHSTLRDEEDESCWCRWLAIDIDRHDDATDPEATRRAGLAFYDKASALGCQALLLDSNGNGGFHLVILFDGFVSSDKVYAFGVWLTRDWKTLGLEQAPELFPKQASIKPGGFGNWLRLPGRHHTREHYTRAWDGSAWLEGNEAINLLVATTGAEPSLIPPEALAPQKSKARPKRSPQDFDLNREVKLASDALDYLDPSSPYPEWLEIGMALTPLGRDGLELWDRWSSASDKYQEGACDRKWRSFGRAAGGKTLGTLYHLAKSRGFEFPRNGTSENANGHPATEVNGHSGNGKPPARIPGAEAAGPKRPVIFTGVDIHRVIDDAEAAIASDQSIYKRGSTLVRVVWDESGRTGRYDPARAIGTPRIVELCEPSAVDALSRLADWRSRKTLASGEWVETATTPPKAVVQGLLARQIWPKVRPISGVIEAPTIRPDGTILDVPGWDEATALVFAPSISFPPIPSEPTEEDAKAATEDLLYIIKDFPFKNDASRSGWLAALLTVMARSLVEGPTPLFAIDGNVAAAGKTLRCDVRALVGTGRTMARRTYSASSEETSKVIVATAIAGDRTLLYDNVPRSQPFGNGPIDACLTSRTVQGRVLGRSVNTPELPWDTVMFATGNHMVLTGDTCRRGILIPLESSDADPAARTEFTIPGDLRAYVLLRRPQLVASALTLLRAFIVLRPKLEKLVGMDYLAWSDNVRAAVAWATGHDPRATHVDVLARDPEREALETLIKGLRDLCKFRGDGGSMTSGAILKALENADADQYHGLRDLFAEWTDGAGLPSARIIGSRLGGFRNQPTGFGTIDCRLLNGTNEWLVRPPRSQTSLLSYQD